MFGLVILVVIQFLTLSLGSFSLFDTNRDEMIDVWISNDSGNRIGEAVVEGDDGETAANPIKAYLPVGVLSSPSNTDYSTLARADDIEIQADSYVQIRVGFRNDKATTLYLFVAVKEENSDYTTIQTVGSIPRVTTGNYEEFNLTFSLEDLESFSNIDYENTGITKYSVYIFSHQNPLSSGDDLETAGIPMDEGLHFDLYFSQDRPENALDLERLAKGDGRLWATFSGGQGLISNTLIRRMIVLRDANCSTTDDYFQAPGLEVLSYEEVSFSGVLLIQQLENGIPYCIRLAMEDKFQFATPLSDPLTETPESIEALLNTQDCYLFSAGFKKDHYVIHTLRNFRDEFLYSFYWGKKLIQWYESTAPRYAGLIRSNSFLGFSIQAIGYILFFLIKFYIHVLFFPCILFFAWIGRRFFYQP